MDGKQLLIPLWYNLESTIHAPGLHGCQQSNVGTRRNYQLFSAENLRSTLAEAIGRVVDEHLAYKMEKKALLKKRSADETKPIPQYMMKKPLPRPLSLLHPGIFRRLRAQQVPDDPPLSCPSG
ncbi:Highly reducing polyketide synthase fogA [Trichinella spiralis]|uniref:Highly reducing polyketide synthase fogA n=1 Tax=Trichinella spiralis TaxID=6334 RepID=A0ABR3KF01_TRISP